MNTQHLEACPQCREQHDPAQVHVCSGISLDESKPMTRDQAVIYVQHLVVEYLKGELVAFQKNLAMPDLLELDKVDTELVIAVAVAIVKTLTTSNVLLANSTSNVVIPGSVLPNAFPLRG